MELEASIGHLDRARLSELVLAQRPIFYRGNAALATMLRQICGYWCIAFFDGYDGMDL